MIHGFIRDLFLVLDKGVYTILSVIFQLIVDLSNFRLFSNEAITSFSNRIYLILGIVMVFKLMISFIQILINPDNMQDKEKGLGGILKRVVISLVLIVMVRPIFDFSRQLQEKLLPIIPKVILAAKADTFDDGEVTTSAGRLLSYYSFIPFFYPYPGCEGESHLAGLGTDTNATISSVNDISSKEAKRTCTQSTDDDGYLYRYQMGISTLVGAFLIYVLVTVALKIAIRAIKLSLCEILAPIPIASYIDPKTSKQSFDKWVETSIKTYLDLFTRLAVVYFVIYVFTLLFTSQNNGLTKFQELIGQYNGDTGRALLVTLFIIVGLLYFAKEMPKFITSMLGVPEGFSDIGDMFKGQGWRALGGAAGMATAPISTALSNYNYSRIKGESRVNALRRAAGGLIAGTARSATAVANGKGWKGTREARDTAFANSRRRVNTARLRADDRRRYQDEYTPAEYREAFRTIDENIKHEQEIMDRARRSGDMAQVRISQQNIDKYKEDRKKEQERLETYRNSRTFTPPAGSIRSRIQDAWTDFSGTPLPTSQSYSQAASLMKSGKNDIFNQAKTKVAERPDLIKDEIELKDADGNAVTLTEDILDNNGNVIGKRNLTDVNGNEITKAKFSDVYDAYKAMQEGRRITTKGFENMSRSQLEAIYGNVWKEAAAKYVDGVNSNTIDNTSMKNAINQWQMKFDNDTVITADDRKDVSGKIARVGYGNFFKSSDDKGAEFETQAMRLKATEEAKKGDKS